jgi:hypothetical protein
LSRRNFKQGLSIFKKRKSVRWIAIVTVLVLAAELDLFCQTNLNEHPKAPKRTLRGSVTNRNASANTNYAAAMEALVKAEAELERQLSPRILPPVPAPDPPGIPMRPERRIFTNQETLSNPSAITHYHQSLFDTNLPPNLRKAYEVLLNDTQQKNSEFQTNQLLWDNLLKARQTGRPEDVDGAKHELADFLSAFSRRAYGKSYPSGTSLEVMLADFKARATASRLTSTNSASKSLP